MPVSADTPRATDSSPTSLAPASPIAALLVAVYFAGGTTRRRIVLSMAAADRERARALSAGHAVSVDVVLVSRVNSAAERESAMADLAAAGTTAVAS